MSMNTKQHLKIAVFCSLGLLGGCTTSLHGSFIAHSMIDQESLGSAQELGNIEGRSCQTRLLYVLAKGDPATTDEAIEDAKSQLGQTRFIGDISIDDEVKWSFLYSVQCIVVRATAYQ